MTPGAALAGWMMTAMCEWGMSRERIWSEWSWSYLRLMQQTWNERVGRMNEAGGGGGERRVSDTEMLSALGI